VIGVTPAEPSHADAVLALAEEMDRFYGDTEIEPPVLRHRQLNEAIFGERPCAYALRAWDENRLVGFAAYSFLWPAAGLTRSLFLKELYVVEAARRSGVGRQLMQELLRVATKAGCNRIEWQTETTNRAARAFYASLGASEFQGKVHYRVEGGSLQPDSHEAGRAG
jgi:GNAT superfamily N-acetyltransferase